ncbi:MAG: hypothetical protein JOZ41_13885, partial [Chloroflexi bacterium]|nr:hypothetical protein [Chloroflexota bacterium]
MRLILHPLTPQLLIAAATSSVALAAILLSYWWDASSVTRLSGIEVTLVTLYLVV